jgi:CheY-like chemotaxis protein
LPFCEQENSRVTAIKIIKFFNCFFIGKGFAEAKCNSKSYLGCSIFVECVFKGAKKGYSLSKWICLTFEKIIFLNKTGTYIIIFLKKIIIRSMETLEKTKEGTGTKNKTKVPADKINLFIIDDDSSYSETLRDSLEKEFHDRLNVTVFPTGESAVQEIQNAEKKPQVVLLDYLGNKPLDPKSDKHIVDDISNISPQTGIIMLSDKKYEDRAMKALAHGAHDYVVKDKFAMEHVVNSVKKVLNPPKL